MMLLPCENVFWALPCATTTKFATSRAFESIPEVKVDTEPLFLAERPIRSKAADFDPSKVHDYFEIVLVEMLTKKQVGLPESPTGPPHLRVNNVKTDLCFKVQSERVWL